mmetsp:Transcript_21281/g.32750  ORF Transcript_21281/g.32750 Transcript_21281/m.32750 type:complete len:303 (-) Transcript_21281:37-945(-)
MVYHSELWISLYAITGAMYFLTPYASFIPVVTAYFNYVWSDLKNIRFISVLLLSFVGHGLFLIIKGVLEFGAKYVKSTSKHTAILHCVSPRILLTRVFIGWLAPIILIQMSLQVVSSVFYYGQHYLLRNLLDHPVAVAFVWTVVFLLGLAVRSATAVKYHNNLRCHERQKMAFVALVLPIVPCLSVGKIIFIVWGLSRDDHYLSLGQGRFGTMEADLIRFFLLVLLPLGIRLVLYYLPAIESTDRNRSGQDVLHFIWPTIIHIYCYMFMFGEGYFVGEFVACLAGLDAAVFSYELTKDLKRN